MLWRLSTTQIAICLQIRHASNQPQMLWLRCKYKRLMPPKQDEVRLDYKARFNQVKRLSVLSTCALWRQRQAGV